MSAASENVRSDLRFAAFLVLALAVAGAILGLVWNVWSPTRPAGEIFGNGIATDETEAFVAGDGRYLVLCVVAGLAVAVGAWTSSRHRGPLVLLGLAVGGLAGSLLTELVGHLTGGGSFTGPKYVLSDGSTVRITTHLPLSLHLPGLVFVEAALATLVYGLLVAFAAADDLGRPDPVRAELLSVRAGDHAQYGGGYGDAAGALQESDLPSQ